MEVAQSCPALCDPIDDTVHGILQGRILEWVAFPFSRGSSQPRDWSQVSCTAGGFFTSWATGKPLVPVINAALPFTTVLFQQPALLCVGEQTQVWLGNCKTPTWGDKESLRGKSVFKSGNWKLNRNYLRTEVRAWEGVFQEEGITFEACSEKGWEEYELLLLGPIQHFLDGKLLKMPFPKLLHISNCISFQWLKTNHTSLEQISQPIVISLPLRCHFLFKSVAAF